MNHDFGFTRFSASAAAVATSAESSGPEWRGDCLLAGLAVPFGSRYRLTGGRDDGGVEW